MTASDPCTLVKTDLHGLWAARNQLNGDESLEVFSTVKHACLINDTNLKTTVGKKADWEVGFGQYVFLH